jgi:hypothetical protein
MFSVLHPLHVDGLVNETDLPWHWEENGRSQTCEKWILLYYIFTNIKDSLLTKNAWFPDSAYKLAYSSIFRIRL